MYLMGTLKSKFAVRYTLSVCVRPRSSAQFQHGVIVRTPSLLISPTEIPLKMDSLGVMWSVIALVVENVG